MDTKAKSGLENTPMIIRHMYIEQTLLFLHFMGDFYLIAGGP